MLRKILFVLGIAALTGNYAVAQNATIKGRVIDAESKAPVESASIQLMRDGQMELGTRTDEKGNFVLSPVASGTYDLVVSYIKYQKYTLKDLEIQGNITKIIDDVSLETSDKVLKNVEVVAVRPIIETGRTESVQRVSAKDMQNMASKDLSSVVATMAGVVTTAAGTSYRGNRYGEEGYMVDGVSVSMLPPRIAIAEFAFMQGAIPAEYAESAVYEIETRGYSSVHHGSVEAESNVQGYNNYLLDFYLTGPIAKRLMDKKDDKKTVFIGYSLSGRGRYTGGTAVRGGTYRASQKTIDYLIENPFRIVEGGTSSLAAISPNLNYVTNYKEGEILSLEEKKRLRVQNAWGASGNINGRLDFRITKNLDLMVRGNVSYGKGKSWSFANSLFNSKNNGMSESLGWDLSARITHRITTAQNSKIKNVFYRLYGYYYHGNSSYYSDVHKDRVFDYGYIGKYDYVWRNAYSLVEGFEWDGQKRDVWVMQTPSKIAINFDGSTSTNPELAKYTSSAIDRLVSIGGLDPTKTRRSGELYNGELPSNAAYDLFSAPGVPYNGYGKSLSDRASAKAIFSFDIGNHSVKFGFDFEQGTYRSYSMSPVGLWKIMQNITNTHIMQIDTVPHGVYDEFGRFLDTINYDRLVNAGAQSKFDKEIRTKLGAGPQEWVNVDAYEPSMYSLDMFSPDDLFNNGQLLDNARILSFYGYNYTGSKATNKPITMDDMQKWFDGKHNYMDFETIGADKPMRISAYLMDKFSIKTLFFDLGLRLDVFDKNQPYVKDMFLYRDAYTVAEALNSNRISSEVQGNIPDFIKENPSNYYVYVANADAATVNITAYRSGKTWYNAKGQEVTDPATLASDAGATELIPLYKQAPGPSDITKVSYTAFAAYTPTFQNGGISLSPRVAFAFAVGERSKFTASYNVITKNKNYRLDPVAYLYFTPYAALSDRLPLSNPGLKPEKDINYEIGFEQALNDNFKVTFQAFYSEKRDQVVVYNFNQAYPTSYFSYTNMDFGTTQGFIFGIELRKIKNLGIRANYTLQFAKGTGSDPASSLALIRSGAPNLRTLTALSFDQRHVINVVLDYAFSQGGDYNGPVTRKEIKNTGKIREIKWLQLAGINLTFSGGSGLPYTASSEPYSTLISGQGTRVVQGSINGSRMPWIFNCDLSIYKGFPLVLKDSDDPNKRKMGSLRVALNILNILQLDQIDQVYAYTGSPTDDGFLTASKYQSYINSRDNLTSFVDYYTIAMGGVNRLGSPRMFNLSISFNF